MILGGRRNAKNPYAIQESLSLYNTIDQVLPLAGAAIALAWCISRVRQKPSPIAVVSLEDRKSTLREDTVLSVVLVYLFGVMIFSGIAQFLVPDSGDIRGVTLVGNGAHVVGTIACLVIASKHIDGGLRRFLFGTRGSSILQSAISLIAMTVLALGLCPLVLDSTVASIRFFDAGYQFSSHPTIVALNGNDVGLWTTVTLWVGASVIAPIAEEAFFRGILQTFALRAFASRRLAIILASLAFGLVHFQQPHAIPALVVLGIILGYAYERRGALFWPIVIHAIFNLKTLIWSAAAGNAPG